jgi:putative ABC transport system permease protein
MGVNTTVIAFALVAAAITAVVFGLLPAIQLSRPSLTSTLRDGGRSVTGGAARSRLRRALVVVEIAVALPLLIASGLSAIGAHRFATGPQGYDPDGVFRLRSILPETTYPDDDSRRRFAEQVVRKALEQPGVVMAATTTTVPSSASNATRRLEIDGRPADPERPLSINYRAVSPGYLPLLRVPILHGRGLTEADRSGTEPVVVISESAAGRYWPGESAIGKRIRLGGADRPWLTVVGVSGDTIDDWFSRRGVPTAFVPVAQAPSLSVCLVLRTNGDPAALAGAARAAVAAVDRAQPVFDAVTMRDALRIRTTGLRFIGGMMAAFGAIALVLAALGIYSVMAYHVAQRRHEMGIRLALGATGGDVLRLTLGQGARMSGLGIVIGLALGLALARVLESALFGVVAAEPWLFAAVAVTLAAIACLASVIPARFAAATDPLIALREA